MITPGLGLLVQEQQQQLREKDARIADLDARLAALERSLGTGTRP